MRQRISAARTLESHSYHTKDHSHKSQGPESFGDHSVQTRTRTSLHLPKSRAAGPLRGIEHLASLPRGTAELGFYATPDEHTPILSIRRGNELEDLPRYEYLATSSESFARYVHARANRKDAFYIQPAGAVDVCNVPVPVRTVKAPEAPASKKKRPR